MIIKTVSPLCSDYSDTDRHLTCLVFWILIQSNKCWEIGVYKMHFLEFMKYQVPSLVKVDVGHILPRV